MNGLRGQRWLAAVLVGLALTAGTAVAQTGGATGTGTTGSGTTATTDPFMAEFAVAWALAESLADEFDITFESPTEQLFFVLLVMEVRQQLMRQQFGTTQRGGFGGQPGGFGGGRVNRVPGGFDPRPTPGSGTSGTGATSSGTPR